LQETEQLVKTFQLGESIQFLLCNDLLNKHTLNGPDYDTYTVTNPTGTAPLRYAKGRKVLVDFGYGIDRELFQPHPAIVLGDFQELLVVAPTNSDDGAVFHVDIKKAIIRVPNDDTKVPGHRPIFPKDTIINLHQIRYVSKNRVHRDLYCNVNNYIVPSDVINELNRYLPYPVLQHGDHLLRAIEMKLTHLYAPDALHEIKRLNTQITAFNSQIAVLNAQMEAAAATEHLSKK
jgi:hypothetical protein